MTISSSRLGVLTTVALHVAVLAGLLAYSRRDDVAAAATSPSDVAGAPDTKSGKRDSSQRVAAIAAPARTRKNSS